METPIEVIGFETIVGEKSTGVRVYGLRDITSESGTGKEAVRLYFNPEYCKYEPKLGQKIIAIEGRYGIDRIIVVG